MSKLFDIGRQIIIGRNTLDRLSEKRLNKWGNHIIKKVEVIREPLTDALLSFADILTLGTLKKALKRENFDKLFHLQLRLHLDNGIELRLEKNETIKLSRSKKGLKRSKEMDIIEIPVKKNITLKGAYDNVKKYYDNDKVFFNYDSLKNNCQRFVNSFLKANKRYFKSTEKDYEFIKQNTDFILTEFPKTSKVFRVITQIANRLGVIATGGKLDLQKIKSDSNNIVNMKSADKIKQIKNETKQPKKKRALSAYNVYVKERMKELKDMKNVRDKMKIVSKEWRQLTKEQKDNYNVLSGGGVDTETRKRIKEREKLIKESKNQIGGNDKQPAGNLMAWVGNKKKLFKFIDPLIPEHNTYVEPFLGSGYIFFNKTKVADKNIINDLDKDVITLMRMLKNANTDINSYNKNILNSTNPSYGTKLYEKELKKISEYYFNNRYNSKEDKLLKQFIKLNNGFSGTKVKNKIYKPITNIDKIKRLPLIKKRLKNTIILNENYKNVIKKYDSPNTFFYLDPPYEDSGKLYENDTIDYNELFNILNKIKGKFLLSLNDSKNIRNIFNKFKIKSIYRKAQGKKGKISTGGKELLIMNYNVLSGGGIDTETRKRIKELQKEIKESNKLIKEYEKQMDEDSDLDEDDIDDLDREITRLVSSIIGKEKEVEALKATLKPIKKRKIKEAYETEITDNDDMAYNPKKLKGENDSYEYKFKGIEVKYDITKLLGKNAFYLKIFKKTGKKLPKGNGHYVLCKLLEKMIKEGKLENTDNNLMVLWAFNLKDKEPRNETDRRYKKWLEGQQKLEGFYKKLGFKVVNERFDGDMYRGADMKMTVKDFFNNCKTKWKNKNIFVNNI